MTQFYDAEDAIYFDALYARRADGEQAERREVVFRTGAAPATADCHANAARYASETLDMVPVHGWLIETQGDWGFLIVAHTLVRDASGRLIEITPLGERTPAFLRHEGTSEAFFARLPRCNQLTWPLPAPANILAGAPDEASTRPTGV